MTTIRNAVLIALLPIAIALALVAVHYFRSGSDLTPEVIKNAPCAPEIVLQNDTPEKSITRAVDRLRDGGKLSSPLDISNYGDAARVLVRQQPNGIVQVPTYLTVCATQTEVVSINGELVG